MKTFKQIDQVWEAYCKMTSIDVTEDIHLSYSSSEVEGYQVEIGAHDNSIYLSKKEAWLLAKKLVELTWDEDALQEEMK